MRSIFLLKLFENVLLQATQHLVECCHNCRHCGELPDGTLDSGLPCCLCLSLLSSPFTSGLMRVGNVTGAPCTNNCFHALPKCEEQLWVAETKRANSMSAGAGRHEPICRWQACAAVAPRLISWSQRRQQALGLLYERAGREYSLCETICCWHGLSGVRISTTAVRPTARSRPVVSTRARCVSTAVTTGLSQRPSQSGRKVQQLRGTLH